MSGFIEKGDDVGYSEKIKICIQSFFESEDWTYSFDTDGVFIARLSFDNKLRHCVIKAVLGYDYYVVYGEIAIFADDDSFIGVSEYLHRINNRLENGSFELDYEDGGIRFKVFTDCGDKCDCLPTHSIIKRTLELPGIMFEKYGNGLLAVMFGFKKPLEALRDIDYRETVSF